MIVHWLIDKVLPGLLVAHLTMIIAYIRLHFEKRWPYWGRQHRNDK